MTQMTTVSPDKILQLGSAFWGSKTLLSAIELGLFTRLAASGPMGLPELRQALGLHERSARDFFDALVALGMLQRLADGRYANTPETELYLDRNKPTYCGGMLEMMNARLYRFWGHLTEALQTGAATEREPPRRARSLWGALPGPRPARAVPRRHDRPQPPDRARHRDRLPVERVQDVRRHWLRSGRAHRRDRARPSASDRLRL